MKIVNEKEFNEIIKEGTTLVDFFANWCGPCKMLAPVLEEVEKEVSDVKIVKVDVDESGELAQRFNIMSIPALILFKDGEAVKKTGGYQPKESIIEFLK